MIEVGQMRRRHELLDRTSLSPDSRAYRATRGASNVIDTAPSADSSRAARARESARRVAGIVVVVLLGSVAAATPQTFTDETLVASYTPVKVAHLLELRSDVNALRVQAGLAPVGWTDLTLVPQSTVVRAAHVIELRRALDELSLATGRSSPAYVDGTLVADQTVIRARHLQDLRDTLRTIFAPRVSFASSTGVSGKGIPGATVQVFVNGVARGTPATVNALGNWTVGNLALALNDTVTAQESLGSLSSLVSQGATVGPNAVIQPYLMALDACDPNTTCLTAQKTIYFLQSSDGVNWQPVPGFTPFVGSVPTVVRRGNTIYLAEQDGHDLAGRHNLNAMKLVRYHMDTGTWDPPVLINLTDAQNPGPYIDTDLTRDAQGNLVLVYDTNFNRCAASSCSQPIRMAFEVPGSDGGSFVAQANDAVTVEVANHGGAGDPYAFFDGSQYILYVLTGNGPLPQVSQFAQITVYTSPTVGGPYTLFSGPPNGQVVFTAGQASGFYNAALGQYWNYVTDGSSAVYEAVLGTLAQEFALPPPALPAPCPSPPCALLPVATPVITTETLGVPATSQLNHPKFATNTP
jgi:hypothetical protein